MIRSRSVAGGLTGFAGRRSWSGTAVMLAVSGFNPPFESDWGKIHG